MHFYLQFEMIGEKRNNEVFTISLSLHKICFLIPLLPLKGHNILLLQLKILRYSAPKSFRPSDKGGGGGGGGIGLGLVRGGGLRASVESKNKEGPPGPSPRATTAF